MIEAKATEHVHVGALRGVAEYIPTRVKGSRVITGWCLRLEVGDVVIQGFGTTQDEALHFFLETAKQWLRDTNRRPEIA